MLVEIPDPEVILGIVAAFVGGLFALYIFYKVKPLLNRKEKLDSSYLERMDFYERQLIDMKIRLDSLDILNEEPKSASSVEMRPFVQKAFLQEERLPPKQPRHTIREAKAPQTDSHNTADFVLGLITDKSMTSRDIQIASQRSREHTSRLMNKLFKDGYVERNTKTKPYSYSITDKGVAKLRMANNPQEIPA